MNQNTLSEGPADGDESSRNSDQQTMLNKNRKKSFHFFLGLVSVRKIAKVVAGIDVISELT